MSELDKLAFELRPAAGEPRGALVLLHGRGTDQYDLLPLVEELDPERRMVAITPLGPLRLPPVGHHWYAVERVGFPDPQTFRATYATLERWLEELPELTGVPWAQTVLGGFSQGSVMAYALGLGPGRPSPAAIIALSGFIPTVPDFDIELSGRQGLPVAIGHGSFDPVISVRFAHMARERLTAAGLEVIFRESEMAHSIDPGFIAELSLWLEQTLSAVDDSSGL